MPKSAFPTHSELQKHIRAPWNVAHDIVRRMKDYVPGGGYSKSEIDAFFEGESAGKKQVHWDRLTSKPSTFPPSSHDIISAHTASGLTIGHVIRASGASAFAFAQLQHGDLGGVSADQHHTKSHNLLNTSHHIDVLTGAPIRGDIIVANSTPKWSRLAKGANMKYLRSGVDDIYWDDVVALVASGFTLNALVANNKVPDSNRLNGQLASYYAVSGGAEHDGFSDFVAGEHFLQSAITTVGTIGTGVWQGTAIANAYVAGIDQNLLQASNVQHNSLTTTKISAVGKTLNLDGYGTIFKSDKLIYNLFIPLWSATSTNPTNLIGFDQDELYGGANWDGWTLTGLSTAQGNQVFNHQTGSWVSFSDSVVITLDGGSNYIPIRAHAQFFPMILFRGTTYLPSSIKIEYKNSVGTWVEMYDETIDDASISTFFGPRVSIPSPYQIRGLRWTLGVPRNTYTYLDNLSLLHITAPILEFLPRMGGALYGNLTLPKLTIGSYFLDDSGLVANNKVYDSARLNGQLASYYSVDGHTHLKAHITDTPWAWGDVLKTGSNLTDLATRQHAGLTDVTSDQHHTKSHNLLNTSHHMDVLTASPVRGDIIIGNATPKWSRLAKGTNMQYLRAGTDDVYWDDVIALVASGFTLNALIADNKVPDSCKVDGEHASAIVTKARVDAIGADHAQLSNVLSGQHHAQLHAATHAPGQGDAFTVGVPSSIGNANSEGVLTTFVRRDHVHNHPAGLGVDLHHSQLHAAAHHSGGGDAIKLDDLASPDDNTDLNASTLKHGLLLKLGGGTSNFLRADGTWAVPPGGSLSFLNLTDTPATYAGQVGKFVRVNAIPDGLDFYDIAAGDLPSHNHAWADVSKTGSNLTDLVTRQHAGLTNVTSDQHHPQSHTLVSHTARDHHNLIGLGDDDHAQYLLASGARGLSGNWDAGTHQIRALQFYADYGAGNPPFIVSSTTKVANLNADLLEGYHGAEASTASTVVVRNSAQDINARLFRSEYGTTNPTISYIMTQIDLASNNYIRPSTPAQLISALNLALTTRKLDDFGTPDDNTDLNALTTRHGLCPKLGGGTANFLRADGAWAVPPGAGGAGTHRARGYQSTAQAIPNNTATKVTLQAETYDPGSHFSTVNYRYVADLAGYYHVIGTIRFSQIPATTHLTLAIYRNGSSMAYVMHYDLQGGIGSGYQSLTVSDIIYLAVDQYVELYVTQTSGSTKYLSQYSQATYMAVSLVP